jgi:Methyltransferase domain
MCNMRANLEFLFYSFLRKFGTGRAFNTAARARRAQLTQQLLALYGNRVQSGPFAGMELPISKTWEEGYRAPRLLGCYEAGLHAHLLKSVQRAPETVINIGCSEGYYAVGLARLLPNATVFGFDINPKAAAVCRQAAELNGVSERLVLDGLCTTTALGQLAGRNGRPLIFIDCEGAELQLLDPARVPTLANCDIIVETHDFVDRSITPTLLDRFSTSHTIELVAESARDPNQFNPLRSWRELDRSLVVDEARPEAMNWLVCWAN